MKIEFFWTSRLFKFTVKAYGYNVVISAPGVTGKSLKTICYSLVTLFTGWAAAYMAFLHHALGAGHN